VVPHDHAVGQELARLVEENRLDDLLARVSLAEVADAWRCYHDRALSGEQVGTDDPDWWAVEFWLSNGLALRREDIARRGLLALVDAVSDELLAFVGAGPLESFIDSTQSRIRWIEEVAARSARFRAALASVHSWGVDEQWASERLERAAGVPLPRPPS
jgi:hypothetical protein